MAAYEVEVRFVGSFLFAVEHERAEAWRAIEIVQPGMLEQPKVNAWFGELSGRFAAGEKPVDEREEFPIDPVFLEIDRNAITSGNLIPLAEEVRRNHQARRQVEILRAAALAAGNAVHSVNGEARHVAETTSMQLLDLFADGDAVERPRGWQETLDAELGHMEREDDVGIPFPYPKLERADAGPLIPGEIVGISAFSNAGKSTFAANLCRLWGRRGQPVIAFPTEMKAQWTARLLAAEARVRQTVAEKRQWRRKGTGDEHQAYRAVIDEARSWPIEVVNRPNITPAQIVAGTRVIRRRWPDRPVVVVVDHMHRLDYEGEDPNKLVGPATRMLKNFAGDEGICLVLLFQPRKPDGLTNMYRPIAGYQIRGDSTVWNELDVHLSPFRCFVKTDSMLRTPWGSPRALQDASGFPQMTTPPNKGKEGGVKLSDEHVFVKIDKRRVGGEGPTIWLSYDQPSGQIYELASDFGDASWTHN